MDSEWIPVGSQHDTIKPLVECVERLGLPGISGRALMAMKAHHQIRHVQIGKKKFTKPEWVAEWLETLKQPA